MAKDKEIKAKNSDGKGEVSGHGGNGMGICVQNFKLPNVVLLLRFILGVDFRASLFVQKKGYIPARTSLPKGDLKKNKKK